MFFGVFVAAFAGAIAYWFPAQDTFRDRLREQDLERIIIREYFPVDLPTLAKNARAIGRVLITDAKSYIVEDHVLTDYTVLVLSAEKGQAELKTGTTVTVTKPGGTVVLDGKRAVVIEHDFPPFEIGEEFVLFLESSSSGRFTVAHGAQGAFKVEDGVVTQHSTRFGRWNDQRGRVELRQFLKEVASAVAQP